MMGAIMTFKTTKTIQQQIEANNREVRRIRRARSMIHAAKASIAAAAFFLAALSLVTASAKAVLALHIGQDTPPLFF